jgi:hypothetical protein
MSAPCRSDPLRLAQCPGCGYSLAGLPGEGACPECGRRYDPSVVVLFGWGCGSHSNLRTAPAPVALRMAILLCAFTLIPLIFTLRLRSPLPAAGLIGLCGAVIALALWQRARSQVTGAVQVYLNAKGCAQLDDTSNGASPAMTPWDRIGDVRLGAAGEGRWRLRAIPAGPWWLPRIEPVDAEVPLTAGQAEELTRRIRAWRGDPVASRPSA